MAISKLKARRLDLGLRQIDLANKTGLSLTWVHLAERGYKKISPEAKRKIAKALRSTVDELYDELYKEIQEDGKALSDSK